MRITGEQHRPYGRFGMLVMASVLLTAVITCRQPTDTEPDSENYAIVPETTKGIQDEAAEHLESVDADGDLVFAAGNETVDAVKAGDVLIIGVTEHTPNGLLRKVTGRNDSDGQITFTTEQAALEEAVKEGHIAASTTLESSLLTPAMLHPAEGVRGMRLIQSSRHYGPKGLAIDLGEGVTIEPGFSVSGTVDFDIDLDVTIDIEDFSLELFECVLTPSYNADIEFNSDVELDVSTKYPLGTITFPPVVIPVGTFTVVFAPKLTLNIGADGQIAVNAGADYKHNAALETGFRYDGDWHTIHEYEATFGFDIPAAGASMSASVFLGPEFSILIQNVVGPAFDLRGYIELDAEMVDTTPRWSLYGGLSLDAHVKLDIVKVISVEKNLGRLIDYRKILASGQGTESDNWENGIIAHKADRLPPRQSDIAEAGDGAIHVLYCDEDSGARSLHQAVARNGLWGYELIDDAVSSDPNPRVVFDSDGLIHICYFDLTTAEDTVGSGSGDEVIRYGTYGEMGWYYEAVAAESFDESEYGPLALTVTPAGEPHVFFLANDETDTADEILRHAWRSGGSWQVETVFGPKDRIDYVTAASASDGSLHAAVSYYPNPDNDEDILYLTNLNGDWEHADPTRKLAEDDWGYRNLDRMANLVFGADGNPHIFYSRDERIFHAYPTGGALTNSSSWTHDVVLENDENITRGVDAVIDSRGHTHLVFREGGEDNVTYLHQYGTETYLEVLQPDRAMWALPEITVDAEDKAWISYSALTGSGTGEHSTTRVAYWTGAAF
jgi:hypothetical protein